MKWNKNDLCRVSKQDRWFPSCWPLFHWDAFLYLPIIVKHRWTLRGWGVWYFFRLPRRKCQKKNEELLLQTVWPNVFFLYGMLGIAIWCSIWLNIASTSNHIQYSLWNYGFLTVLCFLSFDSGTLIKGKWLSDPCCVSGEINMFDQYWCLGFTMQYVHHTGYFVFLTFVNILLFFFMARKDSQ